MSKFTDLLINTLAPAIAAVTSTKLEELFEKLYEKDPEGHAATLKSLWIGSGQLMRLTDESKTKIDDAFVDALRDAVEASATTHEVELPE